MVFLVASFFGPRKTKRLTPLSLRHGEATQAGTAKPPVRRGGGDGNAASLPGAWVGNHPGLPGLRSATV
jgi:hypothetical protein